MTILSAASAWKTYIRPPAGIALRSILVRPKVGLELDRKRIAASIFDDYCLRLVELCISRRQSTLLAHPDPFNSLSALIPAAAHVSRLIETRYVDDGRVVGFTDRHVAVVTRDYRIRSLYRQICIGPERLSDVVPAITLGADGHLSRLGTTSAKGATYFARSCSEIRQLRNLDLIVIDAPAIDMAELQNITVPCLYVTRDPSDQEIVRLARTIPLLSWDDADVRSANPLIAFDGPSLREGIERLQMIANGTEVRVIPVVAPNVADNASLFWYDVGDLNACRGSSIGTQLAQLSFSLFQELLTLAVPIAQYEEVFGAIGPRIDAIERAAEFLRGQVRELYVPMVACELRDLAASIQKAGAKERELLRLLEPLTSAGSVAILVRDTRTATLVRERIQKEPRFRDRVDVLPFSAIAGLHPVRSAVLLGMPPRWARYVYFCGIARDLHILAYSTDALRPVAGLSESDIVQRTVEWHQKYSGWLSRPAAKAHCWESVSGEILGILDDTPNPPHLDGNYPTTESEKIGIAVPDVPPALWSDLVGMRNLETAIHDVLDDEGETVPHIAPIVDATRLTFSDGRWALVATDGEITVLDPGARSVATAAVRDVKVGAILVSIDQHTRKDVLSKVLEVSSDVPELAIAAAWTHPWRNAIALARRNFRTLSALHRELVTLGCDVQYQTVRLWIIGITIGPDDPENVRRLGIVTGESRLASNYRRVYEAMTTFRSAHGTMGRRIGDMARLYGAAAVAGRIDSDEVLDQRSGLTVADLRDCIELLTITKVEPEGAVPAMLIDRITNEEISECQ